MKNLKKYNKKKQTNVKTKERNKEMKRQEKLNCDWIRYRCQSVENGQQI